MAEQKIFFPRIQEHAYREALRSRREIAKKTRTQVREILRTGHGVVLEPGILFSEFPPSLSLEIAQPRRVAIKQLRYELLSKGPLGKKFVKTE